MKRVENSAEAVIVAEGNRSGLESEFPFFSSWKDIEREVHIVEKLFKRSHFETLCLFDSNIIWYNFLIPQ